MKKILFTLLLLPLILITGCSQTDGSYCADVKRYNPSTMKESAYTLLVDVEDNRLIRMHWPNGGYSDSGEFNPPIITNGVTSFNTYNNVQFSVKLIKPGTDCFESELRQCTGMTKSGRRCRNKTGDESGRCHLHRN